MIWKKSLKQFYSVIKRLDELESQNAELVNQINQCMEENERLQSQIDVLYGVIKVASSAKTEDIFDKIRKKALTKNAKFGALSRKKKV